MDNRMMRRPPARTTQLTATAISVWFAKIGWNPYNSPALKSLSVHQPRWCIVLSIGGTVVFLWSWVDSSPTIPANWVA